ncbi:Cytosolic copper metallochaperone [Basidiobolus ranarum]|uniref:Cytosolic copper metallochaperone n=1 Tax=Basidiobolus ranarum TaxID=34480 RepID=A0ABR2W2N2_9FUNG
MSASQIYKFKVGMTCAGCSGAVNRVLNKLNGVEKVDISLEDQTVIVEGTASQEDILNTIKKTGKTVSPL